MLYRVRSRSLLEMGALIAACILAACHSDAAATPALSNGFGTATTAETARSGGGTIVVVGAGFTLPREIAVDANCKAECSVYVTEQDTGWIKKIAPPFTGPTHGTISVAGRIRGFPSGLAVDAKGIIYVTDETSGTIYRISPSGRTRPIGAGFQAPFNLAVDAKGNVYVADTGQGILVEIAPPFTGPTRGTLATIAALRDPQGVGIDPSCTARCDVYVAEPTENLVLKLQHGGGSRTTVGSGFVSPFEVAVDSKANVYVADMGKNLVEKVAPNGKITAVGAGFAGPEGVAVDASGNVYVADTVNNAVKMVAP